MHCLFKYYLNDLFIEPPGAPHLPKFKLVDIYAKGTEGNVKEAIVKSFCNSSRKLWIVIGITAFGMGFDCPSVRQIIFCDPPFVIYIQQTGWGSRQRFLPVYLCTTQMLTIAGHQGKWWNTAIILTYTEEKSFLTSQILRNSVIYNGHI